MSEQVEMDTLSTMISTLPTLTPLSVSPPSSLRPRRLTLVDIEGDEELPSLPPTPTPSQVVPPILNLPPPSRRRRKSSTGGVVL